MRVQLEQLLAGGVPQRLTLQDGDVIYVPLGAFVYVTGEIQRPGRYRLERDTTILKAVTLAGGFTKFAATKNYARPAYGRRATRGFPGRSQ